MVIVPGRKSAERDRTVSDRPRDRSRERDAGDKQRSASGRSDHSTASQRDSRQDHAKDVAGDRSRDTRAMPDRQPVKTATATTSDSRAKSTSASSASSQLMTSTQPRSSSGSLPVRSDRPSADKAADKSLSKVSALDLPITVTTNMWISNKSSNSDDDDSESVYCETETPAVIRHVEMQLMVA